MSLSGYDWPEIDEAYRAADQEAKDVAFDLIRPGGNKIMWSDMTLARQEAICFVLDLPLPKP